MKVFIVYTYYQLMHAMAMTLTLNQPASLFFVRSYMKPSDQLLKRIKETGVFSSVVGTDEPGQWKDFYEELKLTENLSEAEIDKIGDSIFEKHLTPYYAEKFKDIDSDSEVYIYNDFQWIFYYVTNHFHNIVGVEDGYKSLYQQMSCQFLKGNHTYKRPFIQKGCYPEALYRNPKVKKIISSCDFENLDSYYKEKLEILDFRQLVKKNEVKFKNALSYIFQIDELPVDHTSALVLGQPLDKKYYCNAVEQYLLDRKMIRQEQLRCGKVFYKPHPGSGKIDQSILADENTYILPKEFPIEVLNYSGYQFEHGITFGSTALSLCTCVKEKQQVFAQTVESIEDLKSSIKSYIAGERIKIQFLLISPDLSLESYINMLSFSINHPYIQSSVKVLVPKEAYPAAKSFFGLSRKEKVIDQYMSTRDDYRERLMWMKELNHLKETDINDFDVEVIPCGSYDIMKILRYHFNNIDDSDYLMIVDEHNVGFKLVRQIIGRLEAKRTTGISFQTWTSTEEELKKDQKVFLMPGYIEEVFSSQIVNRLWHRTIINELIKCSDIHSCTAIISSHWEGMGTRISNPLYMNCESVLAIEDGIDHFGNMINKVNAMSLQMETNGFAEEMEFRNKQIALVIYDYIDWLKLKRFGEEKLTKQIKVLFEATTLSDSQKMDVMLYVSAGLIVNEKRIRSIGGLKDNDFYQYTKKAVRTLAKDGVLPRTILSETDHKGRKSATQKYWGMVKKGVKKPIHSIIKKGTLS